MTKYSSIAIVSSFFCLWINSFFSDRLQIILVFLLIFSFGILHGANDLLLVSYLNNKKTKFSFKKTLLYYVFVVFLGAVSFYFFPKIALLLFILVSGYHFGEQQFQKIEYSNRATLILFQLFYGLLILFLLFNFHKIEVQHIIFEICNSKISSKQILYAFYMVGIIFTLLTINFYCYNKKLKSQFLLEYFYLIVFSVIFSCSNLIWGFAIYFIIWHSIPSILNQIVFLYGSYTPKKIIQYFKSAFVYWILSLIGILFVYWLFKDIKLFNSLFFSFLAAITFPHAIVIRKMFDNTQELLH